MEERKKDRTLELKEERKEEKRTEYVMKSKEGKKAGIGGEKARS